MSDVIISADGLCKDYGIEQESFIKSIFSKALTLHALQDVSFTLERGKCLAVVGESGCGKSTLARLLTMIEAPSGGRLMIDGIDIRTKDKTELRHLRKSVQIVFQNPYGSLNPRRKIGDALMETLALNEADTDVATRRARAYEMLEKVGLRPEHFARYPHMFSGGQRQRIAIARALMVRPKILILDEPVSALDVSIQGQVLNLLNDLQSELGLTYVFISHSLPVVRYIGDEIMVMYLGKVMEHGACDDFFAAPNHPYSRGLLAATPTVQSGLVGPAGPASSERDGGGGRLKGELPSPLQPPSGCVFHTRCPVMKDFCKERVPALEKISDNRQSACLLNEMESLSGPGVPLA